MENTRIRRFIRVSVIISALISMSVLLTGSLYAQNFQTGLSFTMGFPQDEFSNNVDNTGWGGSGYFGYKFNDSPVMLGMDLGYLIYGHETRREPFSTTIPDVTVEVKTSNNIFLWHAFLRIQGDRGVVQPYTDCLLGFKYLFTKTSIHSEGDIGDDGEIASTTNLDDFALSYGVAGGLKFKVYENQNPSETESDLLEALIDLQFSYLLGTEAEYLKEGSIQRVGGNVVYDIQKSRTDMVLFKIGVTLKF